MRRSVWRFLVLALVVAGVVYVVFDPKTASENDIPSRMAWIIKNPDTLIASQVRREEAPNNVNIVQFSWAKDGIGTMTANFIFDNRNKFAVKDITVRCDHSGPSGTRIDSNTRTIYEVIPAGQQKSITKFSMGFLHSQAVSSSCRVTGAVPM